MAAVFLAAAFVIAALLSAMSPAKAGTAPGTTFTVDRTDDRADTGGTCTDAPNDCTLREAVINANATSAADTINFSVNTVTLSISGAQEGQAATGDLDIRRSVTIDGGAGVVVGATEAFGDRIFEIFTPFGLDPDIDDGTEATIESLTIQDGQTTGTLFGGGSIFGGGIFVAEWAVLNLTDSTVQNNTATIAGGGIYLSNVTSKDIPVGATATIVDSVITENTAATLDLGNGDPAGAGGGIAALNDTTLTLTGSEVTDNVSNNLSGGIANGGDATIRQSTISGNTATAEAGGIGSGSVDGPPDERNRLTMEGSTVSGNTARSGGGLGIINSSATVTNSTISGNTTTGAPTQANPFNGAGGGAGVQGSAASLSLASVTIAENSTPTSGGGALASDTLNAISAQNTIVADNMQAAGGQCAGAPPASDGFNLEFPGTSCGFENTGENPLLETLADNGGPTLTHAIEVDSPAVDQGNTEAREDQRGEPRPIDFGTVENAGNASDIGAFELQPPEGTPPACTIIGTEDDDTIEGTDGDDVICGLGGNDTINGGGGNDTILGGDGNDSINGQGGNDLILGGDGADLLIGADGNDTLNGQGGSDRLFGQNGNDVLIGEAGNDRLEGGGGADRLVGGNGADMLFGGDGNDRLEGGAGNDGMNGQGGADQIFGQGGADLLIGGAGNDQLYGQSGNDRLNTRDDRRGNDLANGGAGRDACAADPQDREVNCER